MEEQDEEERGGSGHAVLQLLWSSCCVNVLIRGRRGRDRFATRPDIASRATQLRAKGPKSRFTTATA